MTKIRWGLLGSGDIAHKRVAGAIQKEPRSVLLAACRRNESRLREFCRAFQVPRSYSRDMDLLNDPDIDAVYVATPVHLHLPQTLAAALGKKHVLVEKPMALSTAECDTMIEACRSQGVKLGVAYYRRFYPIVLRMKDILSSGEIGTPLALSAATSTSFNLGPGEDGYWRVVPSEGGGGALMDIGSHRLNLFLDFFGEPVEVKACCSTVAGSYQTEDCATLALRFRTGVQGSLQCFFGTQADLDAFTIVGTHGSLQANPLNGSKLLVDLGKTWREEDHPPPNNLHAPLLADFVSAILEDRDPRVNGEEGHRTNAVMERAYASAASR